MRERTSKQTFRIAVGYFVHEATTFAPKMAGLGDFAPRCFSGTQLLHACEEIEGFAQFCAERPDVEFLPLDSFGEVIGGSALGAITREAYEHYTQLMTRRLRESCPVDAVYLALHGAAAVEGVSRAEADLARRVREIVGPTVPIGATFDPHGNQSDAFFQWADFSLAMKYFPHYDGRLQGERAARLLVRAAQGDYVPTTATRKPGIVTPTVLQWTGREPWSAIVQRALTWEARRKDVYVNVFFGFPWSDTPDLGAAIQVTTNADQALADEIADDMNAYIWRCRRELFNTPIIAPAQAIQQAREAVRHGATPVVLADYSDRTGDATHILSEILLQNLDNVIVATLRDERLIEVLQRAGAKAGDDFDFDVGGFVLQPASGPAVRVQGKLVYFGCPDTRLGPAAAGDRVALVEFGRDNLLCITPYLAQIVEPAQMRFGPIRPEQFTTWVVKSRVHFRRGFDDTGLAKTILLVDAPGPFLGTVHLGALSYKNVDLGELYPYSTGADAERLFLAPSPIDRDSDV